MNTFDWIVILKGDEPTVKQSKEEGDKIRTTGSNFERTITVVKGNSSLGLYYFFGNMFHIDE